MSYFSQSKKINIFTIFTVLPHTKNYVLIRVKGTMPCLFTQVAVGTVKSQRSGGGEIFL